MNRKLLIGLGALVAVVAIVIVAMPLLFPVDDAADEPVAAATPDPDDEVDGEDGDDAEGPDPDPVDETFEVFSARDPFQQLVSDDDGGAVPASTGSDGDGGGDDGAEIDSVDDDGEDSDDDAEEESPPDASVGGTTVRLVEVFEDADGTETVQVTVNDTGYEVTEGEDFADRFRLLDIDGQCATFLFGDQRFTLCEGESIRK